MRRAGRGSAGPPRPRPCPRRSLVPRAVTRGLSRKETAPERQQRLRAVQLQPPPLLRQSVLPQHERPASLQYVGHRVTRSECLPGAHSGRAWAPGTAPGARAGRGPRGSGTASGSAPTSGSYLGPHGPNVRAFIAHPGASAAQHELPTPILRPWTPLLCTPFQATQTASLSCLSLSPCGPGKGWSLTSLYPGLHCLPIAELLALPTLSLIPLPFILTSLCMVGGPSLLYHLILKSPSGQDRGTKAPCHTVCPEFLSSTPSPPACS